MQRSDAQLLWSNKRGAFTTVRHVSQHRHCCFVACRNHGKHGETLGYHHALAASYGPSHCSRYATKCALAAGAQPPAADPEPASFEPKTAKHMPKFSQHPVAVPPLPTLPLYPRTQDALLQWPALVTHTTEPKPQRAGAPPPPPPHATHSKKPPHLAACGHVLCCKHGRVWGRLITVSLDLHAAGDAAHGLLARQIRDVDECVYTMDDSGKAGSAIDWAPGGQLNLVFKEPGATSFGSCKCIMRGQGTTAFGAGNLYLQAACNVYLHGREAHRHSHELRNSSLSHCLLLLLPVLPGTSAATQARNSHG